MKFALPAWRGKTVYYGHLYNDDKNYKQSKKNYPPVHKSFTVLRLLIIKNKVVRNTCEIDYLTYFHKKKKLLLVKFHFILLSK